MVAIVSATKTVVGDEVQLLAFFCDGGVRHRGRVRAHGRAVLLLQGPDERVHTFLRVEPNCIHVASSS